MQVKECKNGYFVVLSRGEKVIESLRELVAAKEIGSGTITGIGAVKNTRLGFYHLERKAYEEKLFADDAELVNLNGNVSWFDGKPVIHIHLTIGLDDFTAAAGHLFEAEIAVTGEIFLARQEVTIQRLACPAVGLNLQEL